MLLRFFRNGATPVKDPKPIPSAQGILENINYLTIMPDTAIRAMAAANDPSVGLAEYADVIMRDTAVTTAVLKLANSPMYKGAYPVSNLREAIARLGMAGCSKLMTTIGMRGLFKDADQKTAKKCNLLWKHSFFTASLCTEINSAFSLGFHGQEFTAGFLHDLGRFLIAIMTPDAFATVDPMNFRERGVNVLDRESHVLGTNHCEIGHRFCREHDLPIEIEACLNYHHDVMAAESSAKLVSLVAFADDLANHVLDKHTIKDYSLEGCDAFSRLQHECNHRLDQAACVGQLKSIVVQAMKSTRTFLKASYR